MGKDPKGSKKTLLRKPSMKIELNFWRVYRYIEASTNEASVSRHKGNEISDVECQMRIPQAQIPVAVGWHETFVRYSLYSRIVLFHHYLLLISRRRLVLTATRFFNCTANLDCVGWNNFIRLFDVNIILPKYTSFLKISLRFLIPFSTCKWIPSYRTKSF